MRRTRIKICGVRDLETALAAAAAGADAIGLVFVDASPRSIPVEQARAIILALPAFIEPVGLFVDAAPDHIRQTAASVGLRTVQLHGRETPDDLRQLTGLRVIKAVAFDAGQMHERLDLWRTGCPNLAALLWDAPPPPEEHLPGGSGHPFDWNELARFEREGGLDNLPPAILAGGLTPENVGQAIATVAPYAVDVSSGVESSRGVKDIGLIASFCRAVRQADSSRI
jgi:phosphoribosylanthranilate isomerase